MFTPGDGQQRAAQYFWMAQIPLFVLLRYLFPKEHELRHILETTPL